MTILLEALPITVGSQRDSRESISRKMASCDSTSSWSLAKSAFTLDSSVTGCPSMGTDKT